jgi:hypothetical protein
MFYNVSETRACIIYVCSPRITRSDTSDESDQSRSLPVRLIRGLRLTRFLARFSTLQLEVLEHGALDGAF